jgi:hypothetical protein
MTKETRETLSAYLSDVPEDRKFWSSDGKIFRNLSDLADSFKSMSKNTFTSHVNQGKNDFAKWIYDVIGDVKLSESLRDTTDMKETEKRIKARIASIKKGAP